MRRYHYMSIPHTQCLTTCQVSFVWRVVCINFIQKKNTSRDMWYISHYRHTCHLSLSTWPGTSCHIQKVTWIKWWASGSDRPGNRRLATLKDIPYRSQKIKIAKWFLSRSVLCNFSFLFSFLFRKNKGNNFSSWDLFRLGPFNLSGPKFRTQNYK